MFIIYFLISRLLLFSGSSFTVLYYYLFQLIFCWFMFLSKTSDEQNPYTYTGRAVIFSAENGGLLTFLQIIPPVASNMLSFNSGKFHSLNLSSLSFSCKFIHHTFSQQWYLYLFLFPKFQASRKRATWRHVKKASKVRPLHIHRQSGS